MTSVLATPLWFSKPAFTVSNLIHGTGFASSNVVGIPDVSLVETFGYRAVELVFLNDVINDSRFDGAAKPQQDQGYTDHHAFDGAEAGDDAGHADSEAKSNKDSFGQDHAHAPTWGMVLGKALLSLTGQHSGFGGRLRGGSEGWISHKRRFLSHERNIPETRVKSQSLLAIQRNAVIGIDVGQTIRSRQGKMETRGPGYALASFPKPGGNLLMGALNLSNQLSHVADEGVREAATGGSWVGGACSRSQRITKSARDWRCSRSNNDTRSIIGQTLCPNHLSKVKIKFAALIMVACSLGSVAAQEQTPKQGAQDAAGVATDLMESTIKDTVNIEDIVPGFETADPTELTTHYEDKGEGLEQATQDALNDLDSRGAEAGSLIVDTYATRPEQSVTRTEGFLATARGALQSPEALTEGMFSVNQAPNCEPTEVNAVAPGIRSCDIYSNVDELKCAIGQIVEVDAEKSYRCERETATYLKTCPETLSVQCLEPVQNCRLETGLLTTAFPDLSLQDVNGLHRLEITGIDGFNGGATDVTRRARLIITDIEKVTSFRLSAVHYRTFLNVRLNGSPIYSGPGGDGSSPFVLENFFVDETGDGSPSNIFGVGQNGVFLTRGVGIPPTTEVVGIDLLDQLVEGENIIEFDLIVTATENGRAALDFTILLSCCANWQSEWVRQCP